jgi:hypothetical protein
MTEERTTEDRMNEARRKFLSSCGRFAVATPPAVVLLMAASQQDYATAGSGHGWRRQGNNGFGNGGHDGVPGHSDFQDETR